jgi:ATP-dependent Lon protease
MPPEVEKITLQELKKLNSMMPMMPEYSMLRYVVSCFYPFPMVLERFFVRNYLELMADLPWSKETKDSLDLSKAKSVFLFFNQLYGLIFILTGKICTVAGSVCFDVYKQNVQI